MSLQLLNHLNGNNNGKFAQFIENFKNDNQPQPRIAWYPSAGKDFRALLYLSNEYSNIYPVEHKPAAPDIFIFSDYFPWESDNFLDDRLIYQDNHTTIEILNIEELPRLNLELNPEIVDFPAGSSATDRLIFIEVKVTSDVLGEFKFPILYAFAENEAFYCKKLVPNNAVISHVLHVRYGGGLFGGGKASGIWLKNVLCKLKTEVFISDDKFSLQSGDNYVLNYCEEIPAINDSVLLPIRNIQGYLWSNYSEFVTFYKVACTSKNDNNEPNTPNLFIPRRLSGEGSRWAMWNNEQPKKNGTKINQYDIYTGNKEGYWEEYFGLRLLGQGYFVKGFSDDWVDHLSYKFDSILVSKKQGNIFELTETNFSLIFGNPNSGSIGNYAKGVGFTEENFTQNQPIQFPNQPTRFIRFVCLPFCCDEELRTIIHEWLTEAQKIGKTNLATNGLNNILQPPSYKHPEFEMRQFERAKLIESIVLSWCKFNQNNFESITFISMDPDFLEI